jgi:exosortase/archaeosortase family protein
VNAAQLLGLRFVVSFAVLLALFGYVSGSERLARALLLTPIIPTLHSDPVTRVLSTKDFAVEVSDTCSGLEGVGLMLAFCCAWLVCFRQQYVFPRALILIPCGLALIFALNVLRIAALVLISPATGHVLDGASGCKGNATLGRHFQRSPPCEGGSSWCDGLCSCRLLA